MRLKDRLVHWLKPMAPRVAANGAVVLLFLAVGLAIQQPSLRENVWPAVGIALVVLGATLVAFDPAASESGTQVRIDEGASGELSGVTLRLNDVTLLPSAVGVEIPGGGDSTLAQLTRDSEGNDALMLVSEGAPAISVARECRASDMARAFVGA